MKPLLLTTSDASGAAFAASNGYVVVVVDIIDMSTSLEAALDAGAAAVFGASPDGAQPPVKINPWNIGRTAGELALSMDSEIIIIAEPRTGESITRKDGVKRLLAGIDKAGARVGDILPNIGAETSKLADFSGRVVIAATGSGGVAFDAAHTAGAPSVLTGTVARTASKKGRAPALSAVARAVDAASRFNTGIAVVAASGNSVEDILAVEYIAKLILEEGFTRIYK